MTCISVALFWSSAGRANLPWRAAEGEISISPLENLNVDILLCIRSSFLYFCTPYLSLESSTVVRPTRIVGRKLVERHWNPAGRKLKVLISSSHRGTLVLAVKR